MAMKKIGKISATERTPTTTEKFCFWLNEGVNLQPFDIVKVENNSNGKNSITYGIVQDLFHVTDSISHLGNYVSSDFGDVEAPELTKKLALVYAECNVIYNDAENYMPVQDSSSVYMTDAADIEKALGLNNIKEKNRIPGGLLRASSGATVVVNFDGEFLLGREGAHLNMSGISGLATKTSYIMFLLQAIQQRRQGDVAFIILNVKGDDLLHIDEANMLAKESHKKVWDELGLEYKPFDNVRYFYPYNSGTHFPYSLTALKEATLQSQFDSKTAANYAYTYEHDRDKLELLFANIDDPNFTIDSILNYIMEQSDFAGELTWQSFYDKLGEYTKPDAKKTKTEGKEIPIQSWRKFKRLLGNFKSHKIFQNTLSKVGEKNMVHLSDEVANIKAGDTLVVDIAKLEEQLQFLVFGDIIKSVYDLKHGEGNRKTSSGDVPKKIVIFVDELNKYASDTSSKSSPILSLLLEITERGRSEGIILFSAEQFKSAVHDRVKGNCSTNVYGRTNAIEISKSDYRFIPKVFANMMTRLGKGDLILQHPVFPTLLKVNFPYPAYKQGEQD